MLISTTKGDIDDELLERRTGFSEDENKRTDWIEYYLDGELVNRSERVRWKKPITFSEIGIGTL